MTDIGQTSLLPALVRRIDRDAPGVTLIAAQLPRSEYGNGPAIRPRRPGGGCDPGAEGRDSTSRNCSPTSMSASSAATTRLSATR